MASSPNTMTAGELCEKLKRLESWIIEARKKVCSMDPGARVQYREGGLIEQMTSTKPVEDDALVQPGVCPPPI